MKNIFLGFCLLISNFSFLLSFAQPVMETGAQKMPNEWIDRLSLRGEQLTLCLAKAYVPDLIREPSLNSG